MRNPGSKVVDAASLGADAPVRAGLGAGALTLLVVGSMIGSGIFSLPQTLSSRASPAGVLAGWAVSILGMLSIVLVFRNLSRRRADIGDGIFGYARTGFGHDMGFNAAWGHGVADAVGNGAYLVLIFSALGAFRPLAFFGEGNTLPALLASSVLRWTVTALVLRGVRVSARANNIVTCAKIVPLALCIVAALAAFDPAVFSRDFTGEGRGLSMFDQVRGVMMITTWVFIGCESATIFASRARSLDDVARASVYGFLIAALLRVAVSTLSLGVIPSREAARLHNPSLAGVLERMVGAWGGALVNACLIGPRRAAGLGDVVFGISVSGGPRPGGRPAPGGAQPAWSAQERAAVDVFHHAADGDPGLCLSGRLSGPAVLRHLAGAAALSADGPVLAAAGLEPYPGDSYFGARARHRLPDLATGLLATGFCLWLMYSAGLKYILFGALLYLPGMLIFVRGQRHDGRTGFTRREALIAAAILLASLAAILGMSEGWLTIA